MIIYDNRQYTLKAFLETETSQQLIDNAIKAAHHAGIYDEDKFCNYLVIMIDGYHNIVEILNDEDYIELDTTVYSFDHNRIYPIQKIEQKISYKIY